MNRLHELYFCFCGIQSDDLGIRLTSPPKRQLPFRTQKKITIPGRPDYELVEDGSYSGIKLKQDIVITDTDYMEDIRKWLLGSGDLVYSDEPELAYEAILLTSAELSAVSPHLDGQKCTLTFDCQPFRHAVREKKIVLTSDDFFNGKGQVNSMPLVEVEGSGSGTLTINGRSMRLTLTSGVPLYIDCDAGLSYILSNGVYEFAGSQLVLDSDWFELYPKVKAAAGFNSVRFTGGISRVTITPRWRWV